MAHVLQATPRGRAARQRGISRTLAGFPLSADEMRANLLSCVAGASPTAESEGMGWYAAAHSHAADLATRYGFTVRQCAGVIAALSPQTGWSENIRLASEACEHAANGRTDLISGHTADACRKASRILQGEDPADVLGGRKVRSFFSNIVDPTRSGAVTVDRHAVDMLMGRRGAVADRILERSGAYALCAGVIRSVARELGMRPHELQAVAWVAWRQLHDVAYRYDLTDL